LTVSYVPYLFDIGQAGVVSPEERGGGEDLDVELGNLVSVEGLGFRVQN